MLLTGSTAGAPTDPAPNPTPDPTPSTVDTTPYTMPTSAPYNAPTYAITPTPDGTGSAVHPSVVDFGAAGWRGWRYWMAVTPYYMSNDQLENPCILHSNDGFTWSVPTGLTNPIDPTPPGGYNSDTELKYNPETGQLVCLWRDSGERLYISTSTDGFTWSGPTTVLSSANGQLLSPAMVRVAANDWRMFTTGSTAAGVNTNGASVMWTATTPAGPWVNPQNVQWPAYPDGQFLWHLGMIYDQGKFYAALDARSGTTGWGIWAATSTDGINWTMNPTRVLGNRSAWDNTTLYRTVIQPHENGTHMRVWYSSDGPQSWRVGYTHIPKSLWP